MTQPVEKIDACLALSPVIPVLIVDEVETACAACRALLDGGVRIAEITLRTPGALSVIKALRTRLPDMMTGAGTIVTPAQYDDALAAGAQFLVSPGFSHALCETAEKYAAHPGNLWLPGAITPGEIMELAACGYRRLKFFPAEQAGGVARLKALYGPFPDIRFCPTGGITKDAATRYLELPNVACIGASWLAAPDHIATGNTGEITRAAHHAMHLSACPTQANANRT